MQIFANLLHVVWFGFFLYLYNASGIPHLNYDTVSVALTTLQIVLVVGGIFGFTYFRYMAERKAAEAAKEVAEQEAIPEARRAAMEYLGTMGAKNTATFDPDEFAKSLEGKDENRNP